MLTPTRHRARIRLLLVILVLLPIDWFAPTGLFFREAGAKPFNIFMLALGIFLWASGKPIFQYRARLPVQTVFLGILFCGFMSFVVGSFILRPSPFANRTPLMQFISQAAMLMLFMCVLQVMIYLFHSDALRQKVLDLLPVAALMHFGIYLIEAAGLFGGDSIWFFALFRNEFGLIDRASGLMSEPSYYGTFAALFATPLLMFGGRYPVFNRLFALALLASAFLIQAKTMFIILACQISFMFLVVKKPLRTRLMLWFSAMLLVPAGLYISLSTSVLDVAENLSSVMRLGSNVLAWRVAVAGYGLTGVGFGQFHFLYSPEFAPDFLMLSQEAMDQMFGVSNSRASTFNLPLRLLVEAGFLGLLLFSGLVLAAVLKTRRSIDEGTLTGMCFVVGSLGFLMTQDSYCLPALAFGLALALTEPRRITNNHVL